MGIDPGQIKSGFVIIDNDYNVHNHGVVDNGEIMEIISNSNNHGLDSIIIEMITSYGMPVGKTTMDTLVWIGRFYQEVEHSDVFLISRANIKLHMCNSVRAKDPNVIMAVKDRYNPTGGGSDPFKGTKKEPGPLYGMVNHSFNALAVAISHLEGCEKYVLGY